MKIFDGLRAWFSPSVPLAHINTWVADGGIHIRDPQRSSVQYFFSNVLDQQTVELVQSSHVVYKSAWITDSSLSRTRQPLGAYALDTSPSLNAAARTDSPQLSKRPRSVISERRTSFTPSKKHISGIPRPGSNNRATIAGYSISGYMGGEASVHWDETQSIKSRCSSRHSNTSSIVSYSRRQQQVVSRFVISADKSTRASILADVQDFTPNANGFVAYKIPKMTT
ncbi:hypothetical protein LPJ78_004107 [Coemansia sp. RSA 989]|nr:hypothetical protein LPJ68_005422 [Coemansia sp. RSA 1086]KAJ1750196.1 hypothetical protein LPJ79_003097 [Coemansia sp. RSA 1821]KAJ1863327.1 hypothetical protein LPJ78_004107 [Coemansia sp. RSA 989]KAJ2672620.1 hypothetical protein IWW42_002774 [Coemansia sp. RSA 1085]